MEESTRFRLIQAQECPNELLNEEEERLSQKVKEVKVTQEPAVIDLEKKFPEIKLTLASRPNPSGPFVKVIYTIHYRGLQRDGKWIMESHLDCLRHLPNDPKLRQMLKDSHNYKVVEVSIGRSSENLMVLSSDPTISLIHAEVYAWFDLTKPAETFLSIKDNLTRNGTYFQVKSEPIKEGIIFRVGNAQKFRVRKLELSEKATSLESCGIDILESQGERKGLIGILELEELRVKSEINELKESVDVIRVYTVGVFDPDVSRPKIALKFGSSPECTFLYSNMDAVHAHIVFQNGKFILKDGDFSGVRGGRSSNLTWMCLTNFNDSNPYGHHLLKPGMYINIQAYTIFYEQYFS
eukprot:TRINITY_DN14503_c0_g1_i2.p1 TRINITY_DN14503_c0_g1~~TRINITY_DN14503_c0_g1_i2.p1  ORF type:complete len:352 (-),score=42.47 TRINITY_DN14503_c0_g1_i2:87-1142(-)